MPDSIRPLSPTVAAVFDAFIDALKARKVVEGPALDGLQHALQNQKFDPQSLRAALFIAPEQK